MDLIPDRIKSRPEPDGYYACRMSWRGVLAVTGYGRTRTDASAHAAELYSAARWFITRWEGCA
jgi:hypothetical protein